MTIGDTSTFAIESEITRAFARPSWRGLGFFVIHVAGRSYGIKAPGQSMLACTVDEVGTRIAGRSTHQAPFAEAAAIDIANAYTNAVYRDNNGNETYFGLSEAQFTKTLYSNSLVWAPDGDEAFDDGSVIMQFDDNKTVRLIAFTIKDKQKDIYNTVSDAWINADDFYGVLGEWKIKFEKLVSNCNVLNN